MENFTDLECMVSCLSKIPRTGWKIRGIENPEMVSDHIWGTLLLALLYDCICEMPSGHYISNAIKIEQPMSVMLMHDIQEVFTGDLTFRTKEYLVEMGTTYKEVEDRYFKEFAKKFPITIADKMIELWNLYESDSPQSENYHIIDIVEMLLQTYEYEKTGQGKLNEFWQWILSCKNNPFLFSLAEMVQRRSSFYKYMHRKGSYQHFQSTEHHSGHGFAEKLNILDKNNSSARDHIVAAAFSRKPELLRKDKIDVLDVGCGLGSFSRYFLESKDITCNVVGLDINPILLDKAKKRWGELNFKILPPTDIGWFWDIKSATFDIIMLGEVLEHVFDPEFVLLEAARCLNENGLIYISVPNSFNAIKTDRFVKFHKIEYHSKEEHIRYFGIENMLEFLESSGFIVEELWGLDREWENSFDISSILHYSKNELDFDFVGKELAKESTKTKYENAWTLLFCAKKKNIYALNHSVVPQNEHLFMQEISKIHDFCEEMNKSKLVRVNNFDPLSLTASQQSFVFLTGIASYSLLMLYNLRFVKHEYYIYLL